MAIITRRQKRQLVVRTGVGVLLATLAGTTGVHQLLTAGSHSEIIVTNPSANPHPSSQPSPNAGTTSARPEPSASPSAGPGHSGLTFSFAMSPSSINAGSEARAYFAANDNDGQPQLVEVNWGDGTALHYTPGQQPCPRGTHLKGNIGHRYAHPGHYRVQATLTTGGCGAATERATRQSELTVTPSGAQSSPSAQPTTSSAPSTAYSNGPALPTAGGHQLSSSNQTYTYFHAEGSDQDGWVRYLVVDWADGSANSVVGQYPTNSCHNANGTSHPGPSTQSGNVGHHYTTTGNHTVRVMVVSVACDGSSEQHGYYSATTTQPSV